MHGTGAGWRSRYEASRPLYYARRVVGCLSENVIQELVAGALAGEALAEAHAHMDACGACRTLVIELARDRKLEMASEVAGCRG